MWHHPSIHYLLTVEHSLHCSEQNGTTCFQLTQTALKCMLQIRIGRFITRSICLKYGLTKNDTIKDSNSRNLNVIVYIMIIRLHSMCKGNNVSLMTMVSDLTINMRQTRSKLVRLIIVTGQNDHTSSRQHRIK